MFNFSFFISRHCFPSISRLPQMPVTSRKPDISPYFTKQGKHNGSGCTQIPVFTYNFTALQTRLLYITNKTSFQLAQSTPNIALYYRANHRRSSVPLDNTAQVSQL